MKGTMSPGSTSNDTEVSGSSASAIRDGALSDNFLVQECLAGSEEAWCEFYSRYVFLMRSVVRKNRALSPQDVEDLTQTAFLSLSTALRNYDSERPLSRFVCMVTERVVVDEYRKRSAAKRSCEIVSLDASDAAQDGQVSNGGRSDLQDAKMERAQQCAKVRSALQELDPRCRRLLELRYYHDLPYTEIAEISGAVKNTLVVRARRCLEKLRAIL